MLRSRDTSSNETPDSDIFVHLSDVYTLQHPSMTNTSCYRRASTTTGFENGAAWSSRNARGGKTGSLKDFSYMFTNNLEISVKMSCCKYPRSYFLVQEWESNRESLMLLLEQVHYGVKGLVSLEGNSLYQGAEIVVWNPDGSQRGKNVLSSEFGEYWRILRPGPPGENTFSIQAR